MAYHGDMLTRNELAALLLTVNVKDVAKLAGVSTKTVYRLRWGQHCPSMDTAQRLIDAAHALTKPARRSRKPS
jgi:DNA-binding XRE family transcriptional regulator